MGFYKLLKNITIELMLLIVFVIVLFNYMVIPLWGL